MVGLHATHAAPPDPHPVTDGTSHVTPEQQPFGHCAAQPLHAPLAHASLAGHAVHAWPAEPQAVGVVPGSQVEPLQQPFGHDEVSQTQAPPTQCDPAPQAGLLPHVHAPLASHPSLVVPLQPGQTQTALLHILPGGQAVHEAPGAPQAFEAVPGSQLAPLQQPLAHEVASQTQAPATQCCPVAHAAPVPQRHAPLSPQESLVTGSQPTHVQLPLTHCCPAGHAGPLPHWVEGGWL